MSTPALPFWQTKNALSLRFGQWSKMNCSALLLVFYCGLGHVDFPYRFKKISEALNILYTV